MPPKSITVEQGQTVALPTKLTVQWTDGTSSSEPVTWDSGTDLSQPGTYHLSGECAGKDVACSVTIGEKPSNPDKAKPGPVNLVVSGMVNTKTQVIATLPANAAGMKLTVTGEFSVDNRLIVSLGTESKSFDQFMGYTPFTAVFTVPDGGGQLVIKTDSSYGYVQKMSATLS